MAAVGSSMVIAVYSVHHTRVMAREERLQGRLAETYVTLVDYALRTQQYALTAMPTIDDNHPLRDPPFSNEEWLALRARTFAFASESVKQRFEDLMVHRIRTANALDTWREVWAAMKEGGLRPDERAESLKQRDRLDVERKDLARCAEALIDAVRNELATR